jgi:hypothetical protein
MAKICDNNATHGLSGRVNQFVYRQRFGKTVVSKRPVRTAGFTETQQTYLSNFKKAVLYASSILQNETVKRAYQQKAKPGHSAYNAAIADYLKAPEIHSLDLSGLTETTGSKISAIVTDNFWVEFVKIKIENSIGELIEEGNAIPQSDGQTWLYYAQTSDANKPGNIITVIAADHPGNISQDSAFIN